MVKRNGRRRGSRNRGYFYRKSHGAWYSKRGTRFVALVDAEGERLRDRDSSETVVKEAYARFLLTKRQAESGPCMTIWDLAQHYLAHIERVKGAESTLKTRADSLFDFATGYGRKWRKAKAKPSQEDRIHPGYGMMSADELKPHHLYVWLDKHKGWGKGGARLHIQAVKRMMNFGVESGLIEKKWPTWHESR